MGGNIVLERDYWALTKLWHAVDALYMWEFVATLDYEWSVIRGDRPYRWTIWVYSLTRVATLIAAILNLVGLDAATPINCQDWVTFNFIFAYLALASSSLLVVFRVIAIWGKNKIVVALAISVWGINVSCLSQGITRIRSGWNSEQNACVVLNVESNKLTMIVILATDVILLSTMFVGLLRLRSRGGDAFALGRLLWKQGLIWLLIGTAAELTPVLFVSLYLNDAINIMFLMPALLTMSIAATRMYRSLTDFMTSIDSTHASDNPPKSDRTAPSTKLSSIVPTTREVDVNVPYDPDHYLLPPPSRYVSFDLSGQECGQLRGPSFDEDLESAREINFRVKPLPMTPSPRT